MWHSTLKILQIDMGSQLHLQLEYLIAKLDNIQI